MGGLRGAHISTVRVAARISVYSQPPRPPLTAGGELGDLTVNLIDEWRARLWDFDDDALLPRPPLCGWILLTVVEGDRYGAFDAIRVPYEVPGSRQVVLLFSFYFSWD